MPVTVSAKKALRQDQRRMIVNRRIRDRLKRALKQARENPTKKLLSQATSILDRTAKKGVVHPNKAARLKSRLAKLAKKDKKRKRTKPTKKPKGSKKKTS